MTKPQAPVLLCMLTMLSLAMVLNLSLVAYAIGDQNEKSDHEKVKDKDKNGEGETVIYFTQNSRAPIPIIVTIEIDGTNPQTILANANLPPFLLGTSTRFSIDIDPVAGKAYFITETNEGGLPYALMRVNLDGSQLETVTRDVQGFAGLDIDLTHRLIFYARGGPSQIFQTSLNTGATIAIDCGFFCDFRGLAVDPVSHQIYFGDEGARATIWKIGYDGNGLQEVIELPQGANLIDVALDAIHRRLIWAITQTNFGVSTTFKIQTSDLAGASISDVYSRTFAWNEPSGTIRQIAIDAENQKIYFTVQGNGGGIARIDIDGTNFQQLLSVSTDGPWGIALGPAESDDQDCNEDKRGAPSDGVNCDRQ